MTMQLACRLSSRIAAFAPVGPGALFTPANTLLVGTWDTYCAPANARAGRIPILHIHGGSDPIAQWVWSIPTATWCAAALSNTRHAAAACGVCDRASRRSDAIV